MINVTEKIVENIDVNENLSIVIKEIKIETALDFFKSKSNRGTTYNNIEIIFNNNKITDPSDSVIQILGRVIESKLNKYNTFLFIVEDINIGKRIYNELKTNFNFDIEQMYVFINVPTLVIK